MPSPSANRSIKVPFDSLTLRAVVVELEARLHGGQVQEVRQPAPTDLQLTVRSQSGTHRLLLSADAHFARVHLTAARHPNAPTPPTFCMVLRKHLEGGSIRAVRQRGFDRIVEVEVVRRAEDGAQTMVTLVAELMGKHSNLILLSAEGTILDAAKRITRRINRLRETLPGLPYQSPPEQTAKQDPFAPDAVERVAASLDLLDLPSSLPVQELADRLQAVYLGMSPFLAREIAARTAIAADPRSHTSESLSAGPRSADGAAMERSASGLGDALRRAWQEIFGAAAREQFAPVLVRDAAGQPCGAYPFPLQQVQQGAVTFQNARQQAGQEQVRQEQAGQEQVGQERTQELNAALDTAFAAVLAHAEQEAVAGELRGQLDRETRRLAGLRQAVNHRLREADRAEAYKQTGELLIANLWRIHPGDETVTVQDYFDPSLPDRALSLDPNLSAQENADLWFRRYRKARDGQEAAQAQETKLTTAEERLLTATARLANASTAADVRALRAELLASGVIRASDPDALDAETVGEKSPDFQGHKIRRYTTSEGYEIFLGETATANDFLTTRLAAPNDLWLHVRAAVSAHVVLRTRGRPADVPRSVLEQAALLCARHSAQKHSSLVPVDVTLRKYVRKPRGAAPGSVDYQKETTLHVTP